MVSKWLLSAVAVVSTLAAKVLVTVHCNETSCYDEVDDAVQDLKIDVAKSRIGKKMLKFTVNENDVDAFLNKVGPLAKTVVSEDGIVQGLNVACGDTQQNAAWHLPHTTSSSKDAFLHNSSWGSGIDVYVVDSGVNCAHEELQGRCTHGYHAPGLPGYEDQHGHGTHIAGIIGGSRSGIAKSANIVNVRVLDMSNNGEISDVVNALSYIANNARKGKSVINLSIGAALTSTDIDEAVEALVEDGFIVVVASGNGETNANTYSPARAKGAITVGAIGEDNQMASYSNFGDTVDILAPGSGIISASRWGGTSVKSGTSMASPLVAGVVASYLSLQKYTPEQMKSLLVDQSKKGNVKKTKLKGTPNRLVQLNCGAASTSTTSPTPKPSTVTGDCVRMDSSVATGWKRIGKPAKMKSYLLCSAACQKNKECKAWTWLKLSKMCVLSSQLHGTATFAENENRTSGLACARALEIVDYAADDHLPELMCPKQGNFAQTRAGEMYEAWSGSELVLRACLEDGTWDVLETSGAVMEASRLAFALLVSVLCFL